MSLEATIQENTNAIRDLIATIKAGVPTTAAQVAAVVDQAGTVQATVKADTKAKKPDAKPEEPKPETLTQMTAGEASKALHGHANRETDAPTYQATADAVIKLARTKGREAAEAVLAKFGAAKLPDVKPEQFADVIAACDEAGV